MNEWNQENEISHSPSQWQLVHGMPGKSIMMDDQLSPSSSVTAVSSASSSSHKDVVGSQKMIEASNRRRKKEWKFKCDFLNCGRTFTAKHNLQCEFYISSYRLMLVLMGLLIDHLLSHSGIRSFRCGKCEDSFSTPGIANRHRAKCTGIADFDVLSHRLWAKL